VEYNRRFSEQDAECKKAEEQITHLREEILTQSSKKEQASRCLEELRKCRNTIEGFDLGLWNSMVESVTVFADKRLVFRFRDETEVIVQMPEPSAKAPYNNAE